MCQCLAAIILKHTKPKAATTPGEIAKCITNNRAAAGILEQIVALASQCARTIRIWYAGASIDICTKNSIADIHRASAKDCHTTTGWSGIIRNRCTL